jgi:hypothetical protein
MGERLDRTQEVAGSIPASSTTAKFLQSGRLSFEEMTPLRAAVFVKGGVSGVSARRGGNYMDAKGSVNLTETIAFVSPRYTKGKKKGQCNSNAVAAQMGTVYGTGSVSF